MLALVVSTCWGSMGLVLAPFRESAHVAYLFAVRFAIAVTVNTSPKGVKYSYNLIPSPRPNSSAKHSPTQYLRKYDERNPADSSRF